jgi:hypothetical protein
MTCILRNIFSSTTIPAFVHEGLIALLKSSVFGFSLGSGSAGLRLDADEAVSEGLRQDIADALASEARTPRFAAFSFPRCTWFEGKWIRHGDWYPDRKVLLWRRGRARWGGVEPHAKLQVSGPVGRLRHDLWHYSMENLDHFVRKSVAYSQVFAQEAALQGRRTSCLDLWARPLWRFVRCYVLRLGFLDGWQGYCIARMAAFQTFLRYALLRELTARPTSPPTAGTKST